jgi:hypothetical protein
MDLVLPADPSVSRLHAVLVHVSGEWLLVDGGLSRNGSVINGERVNGVRRLRDRDRITVGRTALVYRAPDPPQPRRRRPAGPPEHPPGAHRRLLAELARPVRKIPQRPPATDTELAIALGIPILLVRDAVTELFAWYGIAADDRLRARAQLARLAIRYGHCAPDEDEP